MDLDGTISEIVLEPDKASVSPLVRSVLKELHARLTLVAIITGRSARQARDIVGLPELIYVGNHGLEWLERDRSTLSEEARSFMPLMDQLLVRLRERFPSDGIIFEDKGGSLAVHYRLASDPDKAHNDLLEAIQELVEGRLKVLMGKTVINVLPPVSLTKGTAVTSLVSEYGLSSAILIGDDVTDIDSFRAASRLSGHRGFSSASIAVVGLDSPPELEQETDFTLASVSEVEDFLTWMVERTG